MASTPLLLRSADHLNAKTGISISFHVLRSGQTDSASVAQAANVHFHAFGHDLRSGDHRHEFFEVMLVLRGQLIHGINGREQLLEAGSIVLVRPQDRHHFSLPQGGGERTVELVDLSIAAELFHDTLRFLDFHDWDEWLGYGGKGLPLHAEIPRTDADELSLQLLRLDSQQVTLPAHAAAESRVMMVALLSRIWTVAQPPLRNSGVGATASSPGWLASLCRAIDTAPDLSRIIQALPKLSGRSHAYICKRFRHHLNTTPTDYVNAIRIRRAAKTLVESPDKILVVAGGLGFRSISHFHKCFRQAYGVSPARYRHMARANRIPS